MQYVRKSKNKQTHTHANKQRFKLQNCIWNAYIACDEIRVNSVEEYYLCVA